MFQQGSGCLSPWRAIGSLAEVVAKLKASPERPRGGVYVIEFDSGVSKIGCSGNPASRIAQLARSTEIYGNWKVVRAAVSCGCTNFYQVESAIHRKLKAARVEGELFRASIEDVAPVLAGIELLDETDRRRGAGEAIVNAVKESWARANEAEAYAELGEDAEDVTEQDELLGRMSDVVRGVQLCGSELALDIVDALGRPMSIEEKTHLASVLTRKISNAVLSAFGPNAAYVVFEKEDGYRHIDIVATPEIVAADDPRGAICEILNGACPA